MHEKLRRTTVFQAAEEIIWCPCTLQAEHRLSREKPSHQGPPHALTFGYHRQHHIPPQQPVGRRQRRGPAAEGTAISEEKDMVLYST